VVRYPHTLTPSPFPTLTTAHTRTCPEINDSGVYLPPSPPHERRSFWTTSSRSTTSSSTVPSRTAFNEHEPFNISRESFESYRRSFDISARSPVVHHDRPPRASLDSRTFLPPLPPPPPRTSNNFTPPRPPRTQEEVAGFEEVDIGEGDKPVPQHPPPPKKRGLFSRITDGGDRSERPSSADGKASGAWHLPGRRRGQSGQGSELGTIPPKREGTVQPILPTTETGVAGMKREGQVKVWAETPKELVSPPSQLQNQVRAQEEKSVRREEPAEDVQKLGDELRAVDLAADEGKAETAASQPPVKTMEGERQKKDGNVVNTAPVKENARAPDEAARPGGS